MNKDVSRYEFRIHHDINYPQLLVKKGDPHVRIAFL